MKNLKISGCLFFIAGAIVLMGIVTAEAFYPAGYSTFGNEISDLGATRQPDSVSFEPSSTIFNTVMLLAGIMVVLATFFQHKNYKRWLFSVPAVLFGLGLIGVGIFPGNLSPYHGMAAMLTFLAGGVCAITSFTILAKPFKYVAILFGSIALATWFIAVFASAYLLSYIGIGGIERWVAYPIMLWLLGLGAYQMSAGSLKNITT